MQNCFIEQLGIDAVYTAFHVDSEHLKACIDGMRAMGISGLNVTIPHKEAVLPFVDELSDQVRLLGAANTLKNLNGRIEAHVTDPYGFIESLGENRSRFAGSQVLMFGAGGAAKSVAFALKQLGIERLLITDIIDAKAKNLVALCTDRFGLNETIFIKEAGASIKKLLTDCKVVINATAVGMQPLLDKSVVNDFSAVTKDHFFYDLVYNPGKTQFLRQAESAGARIQNGLDMLIFQGLQSLRIWTNQQLHLTDAQLMNVRTLMKQQLGIHE